MSTMMTIRIEDEVKDRLDRLAQSTQRGKSFLAANRGPSAVRRGSNRAAPSETEPAAHAAATDRAGRLRWSLRSGPTRR